jgi:hypothetical protein
MYGHLDYMPIAQLFWRSYSLDKTKYQLYVYNENSVSTITPPSSKKTAEIGPNPVQNKLRINLSNSPLTSLNIGITNSIGERIISKDVNTFSNNSFDLNVENLSAGIYFMQLNFDNKREVHKIIKI